MCLWAWTQQAGGPPWLSWAGMSSATRWVYLPFFLHLDIWIGLTYILMQG